jgi:fructokinase
MPSSLRNVIENFSNTKDNHFIIGVFGEVLADIFPDKSVLGGAPFNVARHLQAFEQHPVMITRTGNDALGKEFADELSRLSMDDSGVQIDPVHPTGRVKVVMHDKNHVFEIEDNQAYDHIHAGITHLITMAARPDMVYFGTLAQRGIDSRLALDTFLSDAKCPRFLDLNLRGPWYDKHTVRRSLLRSDIVKLNDEELEIVANYFKPNLKTLKERAEFLLNSFDFHTLFITCGAGGAWLYNKQGKAIYAESPAIGDKLVDTVGAGDGFSAVCILGLLGEWPLATTLKRANTFAASICQIRGAVPQDLNFYNAILDDWDT